MHELAITKSLMKTVLSAYRPEMGKILAVNVVMGQMYDYEEEWMQKFLDGMSGGTPLEGTRLHITKMPVRFKCRSCGHVFPMELKADDNVGCPECGSLDYDMVNGREFYIENMTVSESEIGENEENDKL